MPNRLLVLGCTDDGLYKYRVWQEERLPECGWQDTDMGVIIYSFNLNISPKMSNGVFEYGTVMLQNDMLMILE